MDSERARTMESAREAAARAADEAQSRVTRLSDRARDMARDVAHDADARVERLTGRPVESWTAALREYVRDNPLQAVAITVGLGYLIGKLTRR